MISAVRLPTSLKIFHGMGSVAYGVKDNGFAVFLLIFYNQVIGIDAGIAGTAIMIALIVDAFIDPILGELSDRTQTRWGRRLPWMYLAAIPLGLSWVALWNPPTGNENVTILWLIGFAVLVRALVSACEIPSIALVPELTGDYHERTRLMRFRFLFGWAGGLLIAIIAYGVIFTGAGGVTSREGYGSFAILGAVMMTGSVIVSALAQHKRAANPSPPRAKGSGKLSVALLEMRESLSNRPFLTLVSAALFSQIGQSLAFAMTNYLMIYVWRLSQAGLTIYVITLFVSVVIGFILVAPLSERLGKKQAAIISFVIAMIINLGLYGSWLIGLFPGAPHAPIAWVLFLTINIVNSFIITTTILNGSMVADVVEASQSETGRRSEGLFFAGYFLMQKCAAGIAIFLSGQILSFADFPDKAVAGEVGINILDNLVIGYSVITLITGILYALLMLRFPIGHDDHQERLAKLSGEAQQQIPAA